MEAMEATATLAPCTQEGAAIDGKHPAAAELWAACSLCDAWQQLESNGKGQCPCGAPVCYSHTAECDTKRDDGATDLWVECEACGVWREVDTSQAEAAAGSARWTCADLFSGASCSLPDDWEKAKSKSKRRRLAERDAESAAIAARKAREQLGQHRSLRAQQREAGVPASERYQPSPAVDASAAVIQAGQGEADAEDANDPQYKPAKGSGKRGGLKRRLQTPGNHRAALSIERDAWEECGGCRQWVNLGRPQLGTGGELRAPSGACPGCNESVRWQCHEDTQTWIQCDECGRWRSGLDAIAAEIEAAGPGARWACSQMRPGATCRTSANEWGRVVRVQAALQTKEKRRAAGELRLSTRFVQPLAPATYTSLCGLLPPPFLSFMALARVSTAGQGQHFEVDAAAQGASGALAALPLSSLGPATAAAASVPSTLTSVHWRWRQLPPSSFCAEYIPGRDRLYAPQQLAAGLDAYDEGSGEHILASAALPRRAFDLAAPLVLRGLQLFRDKLLPECAEGRASAGPVDLAAYVAQRHVKEDIKRALHRRRARLAAAGLPPPPDQHMMHHVLHVSPDGRKVYVGDEHDVTKHGGSIMNFMKSWRSLPIQSWSGGSKVADMPGTQRNRLITNKLSTLLEEQEPGLVGAAEVLWSQFAEHPATAAAAGRMLDHINNDAVHAASRLGCTGWNAYSFNIDYRTGCHTDVKNVPGSYSALVVFESGAAFSGCFYLLPQYCTALDVRQGVVLYHRSGDAQAGLHANSGLFCPAPDSHRAALVLYQTELKTGSVGDERCG